MFKYQKKKSSSNKNRDTRYLKSRYRGISTLDTGISIFFFTKKNLKKKSEKKNIETRNSQLETRNSQPNTDNFSRKNYRRIYFGYFYFQNFWREKNIRVWLRVASFELRVSSFDIFFSDFFLRFFFGKKSLDTSI